MKKLSSIIIVSLFNLAGFAQKAIIIEPSLLEVQYSYTQQYDTLKMNQPRKDPMLLRIGKDCSQFFNRQYYYSDSLLNDPNGKKAWGQMMLKAVRSRQYNTMPIAKTSLHAYLYKNYPKGKVTVADHFASLDGQYEEDYAPQKWTMIDSTKQVLGYTCQKAECDFRGRHYVVWFTPDIPISDGPWKFNGLPGLILEAYDSKNYFHFIADGIRQHGTLPVTFYKMKDYQKITREKARKYLANKDAIMSAKSASLGIGGVRLDLRSSNAADDIEKE